MNTSPTIQIDAVRAFNDNYIWMISSPANRSTYVVDPGDAQPVKQALKARQLNLAGIIITHHHPDHTGGIQSLLEEHDVPVYGPNNPKIGSITHPLSEGDRIELPSLQLQFAIMELPGHTLDHIAYFSENITLTPESSRDSIACSAIDNTPVLFCGDTLFSAGCGRLFEGTPTQMYQSLQRLAQLHANTLVYCTHEYTLSNLKFAKTVEPQNPEIQKAIDNGEALRASDKMTLPSTIAQELLINPFLRVNTGPVREAISQNRGIEQSASQVEHFAALRKWKDSF